MYDRYLLFHESFHFHEDHLTLNQNLFSPVRSSIVTLELGGGIERTVRNRGKTKKGNEASRTRIRNEILKRKKQSFPINP